MTTTNTILTASAIGLLLYAASRQKPSVIPMGALPFGFNAMTVPPVGVFVRKDQLHNQALLDHELVHWQQYRERGLFGFYTDYFNEMSAYGYDHMPMEREARANETPYCQCNYTECVRSGIAKTVSNPKFLVA